MPVPARLDELISTGSIDNDDSPVVIPASTTVFMYTPSSTRQRSNSTLLLPLPANIVPPPADNNTVFEYVHIASPPIESNEDLVGLGNSTDDLDAWEYINNDVKTQLLDEKQTGPTSKIN